MTALIANGDGGSAGMTNGDSAYKPKTELATRLLEYRKRAIARGMRLLTANEINRIIKSRLTKSSSSK